MEGFKRPTFSLILMARKDSLIQAFQTYFQDQSSIKIVQSSFEDIKEFDCIISAGNCFGLMDGGIDLAVKNYFGEQLEICVQETIIKKYFGEMNVGEAFITKTESPIHPFLLYCPTMRVPYDISGTDNVYKAMKAALTCVYQWNLNSDNKKINSVACPGLGTNAGCLEPNEAARQMSLAWKNHIKPIQKIDWYVADLRMKQIKIEGYHSLYEEFVKRNKIKQGNEQKKL